MTTNDGINNPLSGNTGTGQYVGDTSPTLVTPNIGTPSAGTLTNCSGLPVGGGGTGLSSATAYAVICGGTSSTDPFQSIASVGTSGQVLTSNGAGALPTFQAGGGGSKPQKEITWLPGSFESNTPNPASLEFLDGTTIKTMVRAFDDTTVENVDGKFLVPGDVDTGGTVTIRTYSMAKTAAASKNVEYRFSHRALNDGEDFDGAYSTLDSGDLTVDSTQDNLQEDTWTETISNLGWAANDIVIFRLSRIAPSADNLVGDLFLFSVTIEIPRS